MKKIEALIQPAKLDEIRDALLQIGVQGISICEVKALDPRRRVGFYRGCRHVVWFIPHIQIDLVVDDDLVPDCIAVLQRGEPLADAYRGAILVMPIHRAVLSGSGERLANGTPRRRRVIALRRALARPAKEEH